MNADDIEADLRNAVEGLVLGQLARFGAERVETIPAEDHDGDPAILVFVHYRDADAQPDPTVASGLVTQLNDLLYSRRERRFGYISHRVPEPG